MNTTVPTGYRAGIDVGGTFTDLVCLDPHGGLLLLKTPTTRENPGIGVTTALRLLEERHGIRATALTQLAHGTTVATNEVLERRGARTGLLTTAGFRDVLEIGRSVRLDMYDPFVRRGTPNFLAPRARRQPVVERIGPQGEVLTPIDKGSLQLAIQALLAEDVEAIAVAFLFSFRNPAHEIAAREAVAALAPGMAVSLSHEVDPAFREYERTCVTAFDAYVKPGLTRYLCVLEGELRKAGVSAPLQVMQSRGGLGAVQVVQQRPVRLFLSGPAAGVLGGRAVGAAAGEPNLITFDVGGTSCDIALIQRGEPLVRSTGTIDGFTIRVPMVDVNAIGTGGGSIASIDAGGGLRVGPRSAGSEPGPACYGRGGTEPTVSDASVVLGYINPANFAGGSMRLDPALARAAIGHLAERLGLSIEQTAFGIHRVVNAQMSEGIRLVSVKRGVDPRGFALVPLGGGGGMHATALANELEMDRILVPRFPGVLAAYGLLHAPIEHEAAIAFDSMLEDMGPAEMHRVLDGLDAQCAALMRLEGLSDGYTVRHAADVCYAGQSHTIEVPVDLAATSQSGTGSIYEAFLAAHMRVHGHGERGPARIVNLRTVATANAAAAAAMPYQPNGGAAIMGQRLAIFDPATEPISANIIDRGALAPGDNVTGPAILEQADTTTLVGPGWRGTVVGGGNLILERTEGAAS